jgi:hypothetical protein
MVNIMKIKKLYVKDTGNKDYLYMIRLLNIYSIIAALKVLIELRLILNYKFNNKNT